MVFELGLGKRIETGVGGTSGLPEQCEHRSRGKTGRRGKENTGAA